MPNQDELQKLLNTAAQRLGTNPDQLKKAHRMGIYPKCWGT